MSTPVRLDERRADALGGVLAAAAAVLFGTVVVLASSIAHRGVSVATVLAIRFAVAALILVVALALLGRPLMPAKGERLGAIALAVFGYAVEASFFFAALGHGTAAAVTLLFYTYPVFVTAGSWFVLRRGAPPAWTALSLALAVGGVAIVVGVGGSFAIDGVGVVLSLASAVVITGYVLGVDIVFRRTHPLTSSMWVSGAASVALFSSAALTGRWRSPVGWAGWWPLLGMGLATAAAFVCLLAGIRRIGAERTSIISSSEPLAAGLLAWAFLGQDVDAGIVVGGLLILAGAVLASLSRSVAPARESRRVSHPAVGDSRSPRLER